MADAPRPSLAYLAESMECRRLSNLAWIRQAEAHNPKTPSLSGARELSPVYAETTRWLEKLSVLSAATGGDDARVEAWIDRMIEKASEGVAA
ncbi:hypothetical protein [Methylobacterium oxalidis]|uniref:Uncharacterized protein n=1 Tax=Methylobacterium oxalidis TaxID=944322 RepID=A0A512JA82_9HYPH|nr:hypothetical protein [Methylobacterium oxalidis]GEP06843.1 hypothetical protein MOX02_48810 [Methylobacterium oxalidis]GJE35022.1 hypothetical protein LDDCCGHA_5239 [Methylobacterium oxalidis]GLS67561.1 hypothetical protein GCM10007888_59450 [Methylobacterium oxalidis]